MSVRQRVCSVLLPLLIPFALSSQESRATLQGRIVDFSATPIPDAVVTVTAVDTQIQQETTSNEKGNWAVYFLDPGSYTLQVSAQGFKKIDRHSITLQVADMKYLDFMLEIGTTGESVLVTAEAPLIDTTSAIAGTVIEQATIVGIPVMSRIPFLLAAMSPGVLLRDQNQNVPMMWSNSAASDLSIHGGRDSRSNEFLLDGMPNLKRDRVAYIPPPDAVAEFRVMSNAYDAQYGRQAGGTINLSLKSGTGNYHGNAYEYFRNALLNANLFQSNRAGMPRSQSHYDLWGGTFGGPVLPNAKTFFFVSYEGIQNQDPSFTTRSVPTAQERAGDFSGSFTTRVIGGSTERVPITIFDPLTVDARPTIVASGKPMPNPTFGYHLPFADKRIPANRQSVIARNILRYVPLPNAASQPSGNATLNYVPNSTRQNQMAAVLTRFDHVWTSRQKSFASIRWNHMDELTGNDFANVSTGDRSTRINRGLGLDHVWSLSNYTVLSLRANVTRFEEPASSNSQGFDPLELGFPASYVSKMEQLSFPASSMFGGIGGSFGGYQMSTQYSWSANLSHVQGNMTCHYGGEFRVIQEADANYGNQSGLFDFGLEWTRRRADANETGYGSATASYLLGLPTSGSFPRNATRFDSQRYYALFVQNDWRVTRRLTVNVGLRWDYQRPFIERFDRITSDFDPTALSPISAAAQAAYARILEAVLKDPARYPYGSRLAQLVPASSFAVYGAQKFAGVDGQPRTAVDGSFRQFQPRAGFAYHIFPKTVIRGGGGRYTAGSGTKGGQNGFSRSTAFTASKDSRLTYYDTLENPFRDGILAPTGSSLGALTNLGQSVDWVNRNPRLPHTLDYSFVLQQEWRRWLFEVGYAHTRTYGIYLNLEQNDVGFGNWQMLRTARFDAAGRPLAKPFLGDEQIPNPLQALAGLNGARSTDTLATIYQLMRPLKELAAQSKTENPLGKNQYDSLQLKVQRRFHGGLSMLAAYTFSKLFEDTAYWGPEVSGPIPEHKLGGEDRPHRLSVAPIYELPFGRGKKLASNMPRVVDAIVGGWQLSGHYMIQSGVPVVFSTDSFFEGKDFHLPRAQRSLDRWFDTSRFVSFPGSQDDLSKFPNWTGVQNLPGAGYKPRLATDPKNGVYADFGNYVRRYPTRWSNVRASRVNELNLGVYKSFRTRETVSSQFRAEMFNTFNHPRFPGPDANPASASFGSVGQFQNNQARVIQVALKIGF